MALPTQARQRVVNGRLQEWSDFARAWIDVGAFGDTPSRRKKENEGLIQPYRTLRVYDDRITDCDGLPLSPGQLLGLASAAKDLANAARTCADLDRILGCAPGLADVPEKGLADRMLAAMHTPTDR